jgi:hypothetical protein
MHTFGAATDLDQVRRRRCVGAVSMHQPGEGVALCLVGQVLGPWPQLIPLSLAGAFKGVAEACKERAAVNRNIEAGLRLLCQAKQHRASGRRRRRTAWQADIDSALQAAG